MAAKKKADTGPKDYVVRLDERGYYAGNSPWIPVPLERSERLSKRAATRVWNRMTSYNMDFQSATIEPAP